MARKPTEAERRMEEIRINRAAVYAREHYSFERPQCEMILEYLRINKTITPLEALRACGSMRLGARIAELRANNYDISTEIHNGSKRYAIYHLHERREENE